MGKVTDGSVVRVGFFIHHTGNWVFGPGDFGICWFDCAVTVDIDAVSQYSLFTVSSCVTVVFILFHEKRIRWLPCHS